MLADAINNRRSMNRTGVCVLMALGALWASSMLAAGVSEASSTTAGRTSASRIAIDAPGSATARRAYNITIHGFAHRRATAFLFVDYLGCAKSFGVERRRARSASYSYSVKGGFTEVSGWQSSTAGVDHACAYLIGHKSGDVLAAARTSFQIADRHH
jgi:hypothetical protein